MLFTKSGLEKLRGTGHCIKKEEVINGGTD
jgi:hypothetical protein